MENPYRELSDHDDDEFLLSIGFPLGTVILMLLIFILSGIFSFLCHWAKIRSLRRAAAAGIVLEGGTSLAPNRHGNIYFTSFSFLMELDK